MRGFLWYNTCMAGFASYDQIITALTTNGKGQFLPFQKTTITTVATGFFSLWAAGGVPVAGSAPTALTARQVTDAIQGGMGFANPTAPATSHLMSIGASSTVAAGTLYLIDRLLDYGAIQHNSAVSQALTNGVALPRYTTGDGVMAALEVTTATGATAQNCTLTYTNQAGTGSRSTGAQAMQASSIQHRLPHGFMFFPLQSGDTGVRSVQSVIFSAANTAGVSNLILYKIIATIPLSTAGLHVERDMVLQLPNLWKVIDDAGLSFLLLANTTSSGNITGQLVAAEN